MKIRSGFVSNSSSTSFYVESCDKKKAESMGLTLIAVKDILQAIEVLEPVDFLAGWGLQNYKQELQKLDDGYTLEVLSQNDTSDTQELMFNGMPLAVTENNYLVVKETELDLDNADQIETTSIGGMPIVIARFNTNWYLTLSY